MKDTILFKINEDVNDENVLAVLSALQAFHANQVASNAGWNSTHNDTRTLEMAIYLLCKNADYYYLFKKCIPDLVEIYESIDQLPALELTYACDVSTNVAEAITPYRQLAIALGIVLGAEAKSLPEVGNMIEGWDKEEKSWDICLSDHKAWPLVMNKNFAVICTEVKDLQRRMSSVFKSKCVIGYSSFETYFGCALGKPVFEIQTKRNLLKLDNKQYVFCTDPKDTKAIEKGIRQCLSMAGVE